MKLFILGSGFSKAVSHYMPTVNDLGEHLRPYLEQLPIAVFAGNAEIENRTLYQRFLSDPEALLTYLSQEMPWKTHAEALVDRASFLLVARYITNYITECEALAFDENTIPGWVNDFVTYLHNEQVTVATLNYDTILERSSRHLKANEHETISTEVLYGMPLTALGMRVTTLLGSSWVPTYRILKLHGSINWFYAGEDGGVGQQVYFVPTTSDSPLKELTNSEQPWTDVGRLDLEPLIIPPVAEKSSYYRTRLIQTLWSELRKALSRATEIYCVGYSIPKTDLTMRLFLSATAAEGKTVYVVDSAAGPSGEALLDNYRQVFTGCTIDERYLGRRDAVQLMVSDLLAKT